MASREKEEALEHLLYQAMQQPDGKEQEAQLIAQNNLLKIEMQKRKQMKRISLCYLPGILNGVILLLMATVVCIFVPITIIQSLAVILAVLWGIGGMVVTQVGIRYFELWEKLSVEITAPIFKREGKEGEKMAAMVVCIVLLILAALIFMLLIAGWVYLDAKEHGERGWMWVCIILLSSPILGGLIYLIARREERLPCRFCGWMVNKNANYCEHCGQKAPVCEEGSGYLQDLPAEKLGGDLARKQKRKKRNLRFLTATLLSAAVMIAGLVGVILFAVNGSGMDTNLDWNTGWVMMNMEKSWDNVWTFRYNKASENYHTSATLELNDPQTEHLAVDLHFEQGEQMRVLVIQNGVESEYFLQSSEQTQYLPLTEFTEGKIKVRFYNNGVENVDARVTVE